MALEIVTPQATLVLPKAHDHNPAHEQKQLDREAPATVVSVLRPGAVLVACPTSLRR
jgi:hypothetical protein